MLITVFESYTINKPYGGKSATIFNCIHWHYCTVYMWIRGLKHPDNTALCKPWRHRIKD